MRTIVTVLVVALVLLGMTGCGTCAQPFDPTNATNVSDLAAKVKTDAGLAMSVADLKLSAAAQVRLATALTRLRGYVAANPTTAAAAGNLVADIVDQVITDPTEQANATAIITQVVYLVRSYVTIPAQYQGNAVMVAAYYSAGQTVLLAAIDGALGVLPSPPAATSGGQPTTGGAP
jgi:hypothetical protein